MSILQRIAEPFRRALPGPAPEAPRVFRQIAGKTDLTPAGPG